MPHKPKWTVRRKSVFLSALRATGNISAAARAAGISRETAYDKRRIDPDFYSAWESAIEESLDELEGELRRRAIKGTEKTVYYGGKPCGMNKSYSDSLGMFLLKGRRKDIFTQDRAKIRPDAQTQKIARSAREQLVDKLDQIDRKRGR